MLALYFYLRERVSGFKVFRQLIFVHLFWMDNALFNINHRKSLTPRPDVYKVEDILLEAGTPEPNAGLQRKHRLSRLKFILQIIQIDYCG